MPYIPDLKPAEGQFNPAAPSLRAAMAPGQGLQDLGQGISYAGAEIGEAQLRHRAATDEATLNEASLEMQKTLGDFEEYKQANPDESTWEPYLKTRTAAVREKFTGRKVSPQGRQRLDHSFATWDESLATDTRLAGQRQKSRRERQVTSDLAEEHIRAGNFDAARQTYTSADGIIFQQEETKARLSDIADQEASWKNTKAIEGMWAVIDEDPAKYLRENDPDKRPPGMESSVYHGNLAHARARFAERQQQAIHIIREGMTSREGKPPRVNSEKDIDDLAPDSPDIVKNVLKEELRLVQDAREKARRATPEYEREVIAGVTGKLLAYRPDTDVYDEAYVDMDSQIRTLPPGTAQDELKYQLRIRREGLPESDPGRRAMEAHYKNGGFGQIRDTTIMPTTQALDVGFLNDSAKLKMIGYSADQIELIRGGEDNTARMRVFREQWTHRGKAAEDVPRVVWRTAEAIRTGADSVTVDPEEEKEITSARIQRELRYGQALVDYAQWKANNPDASSTEIEDQIIALSGQAARTRAAQENYPQRPYRGIGGLSR